MTFEPSPRQALAMFSIVFGSDRAERSPDMRALGLKPRERQQLAKERLLELDDVKPRGQRAALTEDGWAWVQDHLDAELEVKSPAAKALRGVLKCLSSFLPRHGHVLTDLVARDEESADVPKKKAPSKIVKRKPAAKAAKRTAKVAKKTTTAAKSKTRKTSQAKSKTRTVQTKVAARPANEAATLAQFTSNTNGSSDSALGTRIRQAALAIAGAPRRRVRLRELRARLPDVPREQLDRQLFALQEAGALVLYRIDDPTDIDSEDERASLRVAGFPRHILYLEH